MHNQQDVPKGLLPLVVAVTGHRDLSADEVPSIVQEVRNLFLTLNRAYPHTPLVLFSSLAEGADRLVARTALEYGAELYVVLPMQVDLYEQDFASTQSLEEFRQLLRRSCGSRLVSMGENHDGEAAQTPGPARDLRYAAAGAFLVGHSEILIALWDGVEDEMPGGTSQIVRFALRGVPTKYLSGPRGALRANETGAIYHIAVRRDSTQPKPGPFYRGVWRYPEVETADPAAVKASQAAFAENLRNLERFNRDSLTAPIERQSAISAGHLLTAPQEASLNVKDVLQYIRTLFGQADALALMCRNWTHVATVAIFSTISVAAVLFSLYTNVLTNDSRLYYAFLGVVAAAFCVHLVIINRRMQDRFQDYRALAEGLRVQFYWRLAGVRESVYDHYFARQEGELDWIRNALRAAQFRRQPDPETNASEEKMQELLNTVLVQWIDDQGTYFAEAAQRERELATWVRWGANACLIVTAAVAIVLAVTIAKQSFAYHSVLVALLTLALAGAGLFTGYAQKRAHDEHARRYKRMCALYRLAGERLGVLLREPDVATARAVLIQLGREALAETCDWLLLHRERQIDVPTA